MSKMGRYIKELAALPPEATLLAGPRLMLFLSGSSQLDRATLTPGQQALLKDLCPAGYNCVSSNFPYNQHFEHDKQQPVSLLAASFSNVRYYWHTLFNAAFQKELARHLQPLLQAEAAVIICKSSGLNLLTQWLDGIEHLQPKLQVIALGPVSRRLLTRTDLDLLVIKGKKDRYSYMLDRHAADAVIDSNHFDYEYREDVKGLIYDWLRKSDKD
ncbi:hypothetical protein ACVRXQ_03395 [Streptococcus panodentis]|uniref:Alpha/beta hydrolase n=1 Tax=Streptococcus panodentis TaxID=1581472 RepID=A0ABS5AYC7_9STRE|nr:hypothetical protein [Streptococcus panodentis]MBP2621592.1 hypothetical protein [Streptococcus panodentis]